MTIRVLQLAAACAISLTAWSAPFDGNQEEQANVNSRYTVESVHISGKKTNRLTDATRRDVESVVGLHLDHALLDKLAGRIRSELRVESVKVHVTKGTAPEHVIVEFAVESGRRRDFDVDIPKGVYHSRQGWSGAIATTTSFGANDVTFGVISDGDALVERFAGVRAAYERKSLGTSRVRLRFAVDSYHDQWNPATLRAAGEGPATYRARRNFEPTLTFVLAEPLTLTVGVSIEQLEPQSMAARTDSASSAINTLRYRRRWQDGGSNSQELDAGYSLRAATSILGSDFAYTRHTWEVNYRLRHDRQAIAAAFIAGRVSGRAPLFERFVLGNASTLRGWNKFDLDPLGGDRVVHGSLDYSYRKLQVFYDTGAIWTAPAGPERKQSLGIGFGRAGKDGFLLALAFPLRAGHIEPMIIAGFNF